MPRSPLGLLAFEPPYLGLAMSNDGFIAPYRFLHGLPNPV